MSDFNILNNNIVLINTEIQKEICAILFVYFIEKKVEKV